MPNRGAPKRQKANILITGTPGVGKSTVAVRLADNLRFRFIDIGKEVRERGFTGEFDSQRKCHVLDEDRLLDYLEVHLGSEEGAIVCDYHASELFPERWFDFVFVLRCLDTSVLYDRLSARDGYDQAKVRENVECEIFGIVAEEAHKAYNESLVHELVNETLEQMAENVKKMTQLVGQWKRT